MELVYILGGIIAGYLARNYEMKRQRKHAATAELSELKIEDKTYWIDPEVWWLIHNISKERDKYRDQLT